jgi:type IV pilus assembly protein PilO
MANNLSLSKLPWYGQAITCVVLAVGAFGAFYMMYAKDAMAANEASQAKLTTLQAEIDRGHAAEKRLPEFRRELATLEGQMARLRAVLPDERDVADLLRRVQAMATESRLSILGFTPRATAKKNLYVEWPIGLKLEGTYHDLGAFLERVSKFPRIINVDGLKVKVIDKPTNGATITVECTATTFVLIEQPAGAATPGGASAAANAKAAE